MGSLQLPVHRLSTTTTALTTTTTTTTTPRMSDKPNTELLAEVQSADHSKLKDVVTVENPCASHDMAMYGIDKFDKNKLKKVETVEKNSLPTPEDLKQVKEAEK